MIIFSISIHYITKINSILAMIFQTVIMLLWNNLHYYLQKYIILTK